jgi:hypothetical protein
MRRSASNDDLFTALVESQNIVKPEVVQSMELTERVDFCPQGDPFIDAPQALPCNQHISSPTVHAVSIARDYSVLCIPSLILLSFSPSSISALSTLSPIMRAAPTPKFSTSAADLGTSPWR